MANTVDYKSNFIVRMLVSYKNNMISFLFVSVTIIGVSMQAKKELKRVLAGKHTKQAIRVRGFNGRYSKDIGITYDQFRKLQGYAII